MKKLKQLLLILVLSLSLTSPAVIPAMGTTTVSAATVRKPSLSNSKLTIYTGKSVLLKVNGTSGKVKWISQNKRIVTVDSKGVSERPSFLPKPGTIHYAVRLL